MQILKGAALGFFGFFLCIALLILPLIFTINITLLNAQFVNREIQKLDIPVVVHETLTENAPSIDPIFLNDIDQAVIQLEPWIDTQIQLVVNSSYDYLLRKTDILSISIPTHEIKHTLLDNLTASYLKNPPLEYTSLPASQRLQKLADIQQQFNDAFPDTVDINSEIIGDDGMQEIQRARDAVGYMRLAYYGLIGLCVLLALLIITILRNPKAITRTFGLLFLIIGLLLTAVFFILKLVVPGLMPTGDLPAHFQTWIPLVISDFLSSFGIFSISLLAVGIILFIISFLVKRKNQTTSLS